MGKDVLKIIAILITESKKHVRRQANLKKT